MDSRELSDRLLLNELVNSYAAAVDARDMVQLRSLFDPAARIVVPGIDSQRLDDYIAALKGLERFTATLHSVNTHKVIVDGDTAQGQCYCIATHLYDKEGAGWKMDWGIRYEDRYCRSGAGWLFSFRQLHRVWEQHAPLMAAQ